MKKKILFIDHELHIHTKSSDFFLTLLRRHFVVDVLYVLPESLRGSYWGDLSDIDIVVLWQVDYLAPLFLAQAKPVVIIPMFDASGSHSDLHWLCSLGGRFINFSRTLHETIRMLGGESLLLKYFLTPGSQAEMASFEKLRVFLWLRRPEEGIDYELARKLLRRDIVGIHVHNHPDQPGRTRLPLEFEESDGINITTSNWFRYKVDYLSALKQCNIFMCSRLSEGIGISMLEAMSYGMLVVANNLPTHNEYISDGINGLLFEKDRPTTLDLTNAERMGRMAHDTVVEGRRRWDAKEDEIVEFISSTDCKYRPNKRLEDRLYRSLVKNFQVGGRAYESFLLTIWPDLLSSRLK